MDAVYVEDLLKLACEFEDWRARNTTGDPDAPPHRKDDPATLAEMQGEAGDQEKARIAAFWAQVHEVARTHGIKLLVGLVRSGPGELQHHTSAEFGERLSALEILGAAEFLAWRLRLGILYGKECILAPDVER